MEKTSMNRKDLATFLAKREGLSNIRADTILRAVIDGIIEILVENCKEGGSYALNLPHFGTFKVRRVAARKGRNPRTGETIEIPAGRKLLFQPSKEFKAAIKEAPDASDKA